MYGKDRNLLIDCIRGLSVLMVFGSHGAFLALPGEYQNTLDAPTKGYFGVTIFFVISGFLISRNTLLRYGTLSRVDFRQFYVMRIARILPCLLLFIAVMLLLFAIGVEGFVPPNPEFLKLGAYNALIFQYNTYYFNGNVPGMYAWSPLWSLSVEEVFYFVFPLACFLTRKTSVLIGAMALLIIYGPIARMDMINLWSFWGNADLLSFGCLAALLDQRFSKHAFTKQIAPYLCIFGAMIALVTILRSTVDAAHYWSSSVIALAVALFLFGAVNWSIKSRTASLLAAPLVGFGRASYEVYLFHVALIVFYRAGLAAIGPTGLLAGIIISIIFLAVTLALGLIVSRFFTESANSTIRNFYSERRAASEQRIVPASCKGRCAATAKVQAAPTL